MVTTINSIICPYCGKESHENIGVGVANGKMYYEGTTDHWCTKCNKTYSLHYEIRTAYTATKKE